MFFLKELPTLRMVEGYAAQHAELEVNSALHALQTMRQASDMVRRLEAYFARHDLSQLRFLALMVIDREPERDWLSMTEIADRLDVSKPVTTRTLGKLEKDGLLQISGDRKDARSKAVRLTEKGQTKLQEVLPEYFKLLSALGAGDGG
ncbi:MAG: MarR family transcriptional regulator [Rhodobacteraceae bacterium]|nr:MarR family transcriptional regulator [Paracoccaceae bacterium]